VWKLPLKAVNYREFPDMFRNYQFHEARPAVWGEVCLFHAVFQYRWVHLFCSVFHPLAVGYQYEHFPVGLVLLLPVYTCKE
jgi:hypothetical protein